MRALRFTSWPLLGATHGALGILERTLHATKWLRAFE